MDDKPQVRVKPTGEVRMNLAAFALLNPNVVVGYLRGYRTSPFLSQ